MYFMQKLYTGVHRVPMDKNGSVSTNSSTFLKHPENILIFWSAISLPASVLLIEVDRFLAIRFPLKYSQLITIPRSLGFCLVTQVGSLIVSLTPWIASTSASNSDNRR